MEEWEKIKISDIGHVVTGKTPRTSIKENYGGYIPFLTPSDDLSNKFAPITNKALTDKGLTEVRNCLLPKNSICVSCIGSDLGKVVMLKKPTVTNQQFNSIIPNENYSPDFVYYLMIIVGKRLNFLSKTSTAVPIINKSTFSNFEVEVPSCLHNQTQIAKILSSLDDKIELNNRINANLEEQAQALFRRWFVDFEFPNEEGLSYKSNGGKFVESELGKIPEGWTVGNISEIIESTLGGDWGKEFKEGNYTREVFCIRGADIPDIKKGTRGKMPIRYIIEKNFLNKSLESEDLVVEISGGSPTQSTGRVCRISTELLSKYKDSLICTNFCRAIKPTVGFSSYIFYLWEYLYSQGVMFTYENGTTGIKNLDMNRLIQKELIVIPNKNILKEFSILVNSNNKIIQSNGKESENLSSLRDSLLPQLMNNEFKI